MFHFDSTIYSNQFLMNERKIVLLKIPILGSFSVNFLA